MKYKIWNVKYEIKIKILKYWILKIKNYFNLQFIYRWKAKSCVLSL